MAWRRTKRLRFPNGIPRVPAQTVAEQAEAVAELKALAVSLARMSDSMSAAFDELRKFSDFLDRIEAIEALMEDCAMGDGQDL